jgi:energy-coupling factor transport system ATP-binding protein
VRKGEKVLIAGPSGCGKSTIAHCINGLIPNSYPGQITGALHVGGKDTRKMSLFDLSKIVGTVLQDSDGQFIGLTVAEDIAFALENDCIPTEEMHTHVRKIAQMVNVEKVLHHAPHEISGGQKQRVGLGGVMVGNVDVLLFDEPLANLDPATGKQAIVLIDEIQKRTGCAVVIIEHRIEDALYRPVDRIVVMEEGRIVYNGDPDTLLCSDMLPQKGIREPLYVTALKYAGVALTKDMQPAYLPELKLSDDQKNQVRNWFESQPLPPVQADGEVLLQDMLGTEGDTDTNDCIAIGQAMASLDEMERELIENV